MKGYLYIRVHPSYDKYDGCKMGITQNIPDRDNTYLTGEITRGYFKDVYEIPINLMLKIERILQYKFKEFHLKYDGGNEFYNKKIIDEIEPYLKTLNLDFKKLSENEIERLRRPLRLRIKKLLKKIPSFLKTTIILRDYQEEIKQKFSLNMKSSIVNLPTGAGKTVVSLSLVGEYFKNNSNSVLWITERKDVLRSQFDDENKFQKCINGGLIQDFSHYDLKTFYNKKMELDELNKENIKPLFIITNVDSIIYDERYKEILVNKFGLIIVDECHSASAPETYTFLKFAKDNWINLKSIVGFSATPVRRNLDKIQKMTEIFGDGVKINFLYQMSFVEAIDRKIIVRPKFNWIETQLEKDVSVNNFEINKNHYIEFIKYIEKVLIESKTKKAICWTEKISYAQEWFDILQSNQHNFPELSSFSLYLSHCGNKKYSAIDEIPKFMNDKGNALLLVVGRCREGFDDERVDVGINLTPVQKRSEIVFIQETGRTLRLYEGKTHGIMLDSFTFKDEENKMEELCNLIIDYCLFLKALDDGSDIDEEFESFKECFSFNKGKISFKTPKGNEIEFSIESTSLKSMDWLNLPETFTNKIQEKFYQNGISYEIAKKIIGNKCSSKKDYFELCETDTRLPKEPDVFFEGKFKGWVDYLNIDVSKYYSKEECLEKIDLLIKASQYRENLIKNHKEEEVFEELINFDNKFPPLDIWTDIYLINSFREMIKVQSKKKKVLIL